MGGFIKHDRVIYIIMAGAILFYLPFISRQFMGDDWLWLANAKAASSDLSVFLGRPMYGYFRPLNMILIYIMLNLFGTTAWAFSLVNILLHACNVWLLWILLGRFNLPDSVRDLSAIIFAFYYLNAPAIEWISVGHDLWVTGLSLLFSILILRLIERPKFSLFVLCWAVGFMGLLIKESGFVTIGIYFTLLLLKGKSPFRKKFMIYSLLFMATYLLYLYGYFITRTVADRDLDIGFGTLVNLWYFVSYMAAPISERIALGFPTEYIWIPKMIRTVTAVAVPAMLIFVFTKSKTGCRFFILWSIMFISTIAILKWGVHPFSLYPERTAARFMYQAVPGMAVALSWILNRYFNKPIFKNARLMLILIVLYISANFLITHRISRLYVARQALTGSILEDFETLRPILVRNDTLVIMTENMKNTPQIIASGMHLHGILYVTHNHDMKVILDENEKSETTDIFENNGRLVIGWDNRKQRFMIPSSYSNLPRNNKVEVSHISAK